MRSCALVHARAGESAAGLKGLMLLLKRIRLIAERNAATPAERLLDDLLRLLDASESAYDTNEVQEVQQNLLYMSQWRQNCCSADSLVKLFLLLCQ